MNDPLIEETIRETVGGSLFFQLLHGPSGACVQAICEVDEEVEIRAELEFELESILNQSEWWLH